jgi:universal stress protein A
MYKCIIHPTDLQEDHLDYCEQSIILAKELDAEIYLLHALHIPNSWQFAQSLGFAETEPLPIEDAKIVMEALADRFNLSHENMLIKQHGLKQAILEVIEELQADLLIIGSTKNHFFQNEILQMSQYISQHSACDTLLLHQK